VDRRERRTSSKVYRGTTPGGEGATPIASGVTGTNYTNTGLARSYESDSLARETAAPRRKSWTSTTNGVNSRRRPARSPAPCDRDIE
jgi:hypothetical protein